MPTGVVTWSKTASTNASTDSAQNWAEGMAPSAVNDSARGGMASVAKWRDDLNGTLTLAGGPATYTLATNQGFAALTAGFEVTFAANAANTGTATLNVDGLGAKPLRSAGGVELLANALASSAIYRATYASSNSGEWLLQNFPILGDTQIATAKLADGAVTTAKIADANVTLAKLDNRSANTLIGRYTASSGAPQEVSVGSGLALNATSGVLTVPAFPIPGGFKALSIKVASNTTVTVAADYVTTTDGTNFQTTALSGTINLGTAGTANALDAGTIASATWYAIWAIAKPDGTTAALASTSFTAPTLPGGYTCKARFGAVRTAAGSAQLMGTWQLGREARYILGLAQTTSWPLIDSGIKGSGIYNNVLPTLVWATPSITSVVPSTASVIDGLLLTAYNSNSTSQGCFVAPNANYDGPVATSTKQAPVSSIVQSGAGANGGNWPFSFLIEGTTIAWVSPGSTGALACMGWEDNV